MSKDSGDDFASLVFSPDVKAINPSRKSCRSIKATPPKSDYISPNLSFHRQNSKKCTTVSLRRPSSPGFVFGKSNFSRSNSTFTNRSSRRASLVPRSLSMVEEQALLSPISMKFISCQTYLQSLFTTNQPSETSANTAEVVNVYVFIILIS